MHINHAKKHTVKPIILHRDEALNYIKISGQQHFIVSPCEADLTLDSSRATSSKNCILEMGMLAAAKQLTLMTTSWFTAQDLNNIRLLNSIKSLEHPYEWILSKRVFAVEIGEKEFIPFYALNQEQNFSPHTILTEILEVFSGQKNSWSMAFWFSAMSGYLGGERPKDLLTTQPELVLAAAKDESQGVTHG